MRNSLLITVITGLILTSCSYKRKITAENISLSPLFSSGMVLQTSPKTIINGKADAGGILAIKIDEYVKLAKADEQGYWQIRFPEIIMNEPFSITFEASDTLITFNNVHAGKIYIIAGDPNTSALTPPENRNRNPLSTQRIRIFIPPLKGKNVPQRQFSAGKWYPLTEVLNFDKTAEAVFALQNILPKSESPIGIIDLTWPGSQVDSWIPVSGILSDNGRILTNEYLDSVFILNAEISGQIQAMKDTCYAGIKKGAAKIWYNDESWKSTELPVILGNKDDYNKRRIAYLRKKIYIPADYLTSNFYINLEYIYGDARFYFNETRVDPIVREDGKKQLIIADTLLRVWSNELTVRFICNDSLAGFYGTNYVCYNTDSSYLRPINKDWKYNFNLEEEFPEHIPVEQVPAIAFNALISPVINSNAQSFIFYYNNVSMNQTLDFSDKVCKIFNLLPDTWEKVLTYRALSMKDTFVYKLNEEYQEILIHEPAEQCGIAIEKIE
jgi:sialate O-acetylesterase